MNTNNIWYPNMRMQRVLKAFQDSGVLRVEISYTAYSLKAEDELLAQDFPQRATADLDAVLAAIETIDGLGHKLKMVDLLQALS